MEESSVNHSDFHDPQKGPGSLVFGPILDPALFVDGVCLKGTAVSMNTDI